MFNAKKARKVADENNHNSIANEILKEIRREAEKGKYEVEIKGYGFGGKNIFNNELSDIQIKVVNLLQRLGYKTELRVGVGDAVDTYLKIEW